VRIGGAEGLGFAAHWDKLGVDSITFYTVHAPVESGVWIADTNSPRPSGP